MKSRRRWCVSLPQKLSPTGNRQRKYFKLKEEADNYSEHLLSVEKKQTTLLRKASLEVIETATYYHEVFQIYGYKGLKEACMAFEERLKTEDQSFKFGDLLTGYEQDHFSQWSERHQQSWNTTKALLSKVRGELLTLLDNNYWRTYLQTLELERKWSPRSYNYYLGRVSSIYTWGISNGFCKDNSLSGLARRKQKKKTVSLLSVKQVNLLLKTAWQHDKEMVPYFAIGIFAGLRPTSELENLVWEDVNFEEKWIRVDFGNKTDTKRFVSIEDNLLKWLESWKKAKGSIIPSNLIKRRRAIVRGRYQSAENTLEKDWEEIASWSQRDIMRHSYGSYLDGKYRDRNLVKESMGHVDFTTFEQHYRNARTIKQTEAFWAIIPPKS